MKNFIAHIFGVDKALLEERMVNYHLESDIADLRGERTRILDEYDRVRKEVIELHDENKKLKEQIEYLESQYADACEKILLAQEELKKYTSKRKKRESK